jgi:hypothetical protein
MSDPISGSDVEGVLSRVRRLVSEPSAANGGGARFVLTPEHRVDTGSSPAETPVLLEQSGPPVDRRATNAPPSTPADAAGAAEAEADDPLDKAVAALIGPAVAQEVARTLEARGIADAAPRAMPPAARATAAPADAAALLDRITRAEEPVPSDSDAGAEEALRGMVAQIVRAELRGALGEQITHNLRKMVRREVYRALLSKDID